MWLVVIEQRPKGRVTANESVRLCLLMCVLLQAQATIVRACLQSVYPYGTEKETDTCPTSKLSVPLSQEKRKTDTGAALVCVHKLLEYTEKADKKLLMSNQEMSILRKLKMGN